MNKLLTKIAALSVGLAMAIGVGVAVGSNSEVMPAHAVSYQWQKMTSTSEFVDGTTILITQSSYYLNVSATSTSQTPRLANLTLSGGLPTLTANNTECLTVSGSGDSIKLVKATNNANWLITGSSNNAARINTGTTGNYWHIESGSTTGTFRLYSNSSTRYLSRYQTTDFRSYTGTADTSTAFKQLTIFKLVEAKTTQTITVDPASKEAYTDETISLTTNATTATWSLSSNTCGASLSANTGKNVSVSATSAGSVKVTAAATSTHTEASVTLTFSERPSSPYITPEKSSTSGYTGQNETISFAYGNLTGSLSVSSSNTSVVTVGSPSYSAGEGSVQFNFVGAGSTTVKFKDGSTELASVSVSVTASSVTITGLPASKDVYIGKTVDLGSLISVTATGIYSNAVTWESDDDGIATVTAAGVVSGVSEGDVDITVTSDDYPSATMTCTVSVSEAPLEYEIVFGTAEGTSGITDFSNTSYIIPSGVTLDNIQGNVYSNTSNQAASLRFGKSGTTGSFDATISGNYYITSVKCNLKYYGSDTTATFAVTPSGGSAISKSLTGSWDDYTYDVSAAKAKTVTLGTDVNGKRAYLSGFTITYAAQKVLSNIALSGTYPTTFTKGDTFSHSGMVVTANYSDSTSATVTGSATWSSPDMSTPGAKTITVSYSDEYGSASKTYSITVSYAAPTSITLSSNSSSVALEETFNLSTINVTINPSATADQSAYAWSLYDDGGLVEDEDYVWISPEIMSYTAGTFVFRCTSTEDGTKYAEFTLTVSGDPIAHLKDEGDNDVTNGSMTVFADAGIISYSVIVENFQGTLTYTWSSSNTSIIAIDASADDMCDYNVEGVAGSSRLSCRIQGSIKGDVTVYVDVTVSAVTVTSVTWTAPTINVYSGATLSSTSGWNVKYSTNSGKTDQTPDSFNIKLGGSTISLPHTWAASDDGKTLCVEVGGVSSSTTTVSVTQTLRPVNAPVPGEESTKTWTATAAANLGAVIEGVDGTDTGSVAFDDDSTMDYERTLEYVASGKADYMAFSNNYIQFGSSNALEKLVLTASTSGTVTSVVVDCWSKNGGSNISVTVGGNAFDTSKACPSAGAEVTFTGSAKGTVVITMEKSTKTSGLAQYIKSVAITTVAESGESVNIANVAGHEAAQRAVVKFAKAFNAAMDTTSSCTTNMSSAWSTASSAWTTFLSEAAALGSSEEAYALNLVKYATAQWTTGTDSNYEYCLERAMATYEKCVTVHGQTPFMSDVRSVGSAVRPNSIIISKDTSTSIAVVVTISLVSVAAIGGYFFFRKKKEI